MRSFAIHRIAQILASSMPDSSSKNLWMRVMACVIILLIQPICCLSRTNVTSSNGIYRESQSNYRPPDCRKSIRPDYFIENSADAHRLVVTIPEEVSRKRLKIDVNYDDGYIEFFGWWFESKIRGEDARKMCVYSRWDLDPDLLSDEAIISSDLVSVYDIYMSMRNQQLILSVPIVTDSISSGSPSPPPPSPRAVDDNYSNDDEDIQDEQIANHVSIVIAYGTTLWKKLSGLVRLKDHTRNFSNHISTNSTIAPSRWDIDFGLPPSSIAYEKYRQDALEHFLKHALSTVDANSNQ